MKVPSTVFFHFLNNSQRTREVPSWGSFSRGNHTSPGQCCYVLFCSPQSLAVACLQNTNWNHIAFEITLRALRLRVGEGRAKSLKQFQQRAVYQLAARMWSDGVSWDEALLISERAVQAEHQCTGKKLKEKVKTNQNLVGKAIGREADSNMQENRAVRNAWQVMTHSNFWLFQKNNIFVRWGKNKAFRFLGAALNPKRCGIRRCPKP